MAATRWQDMIGLHEKRIIHSTTDYELFDPHAFATPGAQLEVLLFRRSNSATVIPISARYMAAIRRLLLYIGGNLTQPLRHPC